ncbi:hypothetical protein BC835DRAFT_1300034 [Cytidiella melzeri]|nr:hypothetical protein BC835DRAFT_1300034 [Cytidiella melzeri]
MFTNVPFGMTYKKTATIQRRLAWPLHKDDMLSWSGRPTSLKIYYSLSSDSYPVISSWESRRYACLEE